LIEDYKKIFNQKVSKLKNCTLFIFYTVIQSDSEESLPIRQAGVSMSSQSSEIVEAKL
jgi:hypothetical protein